MDDTATIRAPTPRARRWSGSSTGRAASRRRTRARREGTAAARAQVSGDLCGIERGVQGG